MKTLFRALLAAFVYRVGPDAKKSLEKAFNLLLF